MPNGDGAKTSRACPVAPGTRAVGRRTMSNGPDTLTAAASAAAMSIRCGWLIRLTLRNGRCRADVVVLHARDVRLSVLAPVPPVETVHPEDPQPRAHVGKHDQAVVVPDV